MASLRTHNRRHKRRQWQTVVYHDPWWDYMTASIGQIRRAVLNDEPLGDTLMETTFGWVSSDMLVDRVMKLAAGWGTFP